jgi:hypothetical protein
MLLRANRQNEKGLTSPFRSRQQPALLYLNNILTERLQALGAQSHRDELAILENLRLLNIRLELTLGMPLRKADIVPKLGFLTTSIADCHGDFTLFM